MSMVQPASSTTKVALAGHHRCSSLGARQIHQPCAHSGPKRTGCALARMDREKNSVRQRRARNSQQSVDVNQGQICGQNHPAGCICSGPHSGCNAVTHARMQRLFKVPAQAAGLDGREGALQNSVPTQVGLEFMDRTARREETFATARRENQHHRKCLRFLWCGRLDA